MTREAARVLIVAALAATATGLDAQQATEEELRALRQRIERLKQEVDAAEGARAEAADALRASETAISDANRRLFPWFGNQVIDRLCDTTSELRPLGE